jgi:hypothetical protein
MNTGRASLRKRFSTVITDLRQYDSVPTLQGIIVKNEWALIELLPFHKKPNQRPAIYLSAEYDQELFELFTSAFEDLFDSAESIV